MNNLFPDYQKISRSSYIVLIGFSSEIETDIYSFKQLFQRNFGYAEKVRSTPHLTMLHFIASKKSIPPIIEVLKNFCAKIKSIHLQFTAFNSFERNKLLFLDLEKQEDLSNISTDLQKEFKLAAPEISIERKKLRPHATIARCPRMKLPQFNDAVEFFKGIPYQKSTYPKSIAIFDQNKRKEEWRYDFENVAWQ
ncbi:2'-5' RNA ligase family protein [Algoriphagus jejuensis]|uniref:2'-5' RNA ligase family protein n=1 Tax=Algoriphagus jejuensis TaxID=419934 RepID=UPI0031DEC2C7